MSVSTRDGHAPVRPGTPDGQPEPTEAPATATTTAPTAETTAATTGAGESSPLPAPLLPAASGLVVLSSQDAPMCSDGVCL